MMMLSYKTPSFPLSLFIPHFTVFASQRELDFIPFLFCTVIPSSLHSGQLSMIKIIKKVLLIITRVSETLFAWTWKSQYPYVWWKMMKKKKSNDYRKKACFRRFNLYGKWLINPFVFLKSVNKLRCLNGFCVFFFLNSRETPFDFLFCIRRGKSPGFLLERRKPFRTGGEVRS